MIRPLLLITLTLSLVEHRLSAQPADAVLTQTLITELHSLRQEIANTTAATQRIQIVLYRMQSQTAILSGAQRRLEDARTKAAEIQRAKRGISMEQERSEGLLRDEQDPKHRRELEQAIVRMKAETEAIGVEEAQRKAAEIEAETHFRAEQARLTELDSLLNRLDAALDEASRARR